MKRKNYPSDKNDLLTVGNYEIYNRELNRKVFPRIIGDFKARRPRVEIGDIIAFYYAILSYVDGEEFLADGQTPNRSYGAAFVDQTRINEMTGINRKRHSWLAEVLRQNGVFKDVKKRFVSGRNYIYYYPSFCPFISADGYVVDSDTGERMKHDVDALLTELDRIS